MKLNKHTRPHWLGNATVIWILILLLILFFFAYRHWNEHRSGYTTVGIVSIESNDPEAPRTMVYAEMSEYSLRLDTFSARHKGYQVDRFFTPDNKVFELDQCLLIQGIGENEYSDTCYGYNESSDDSENPRYEGTILLVDFPVDHETACKVPIIAEASSLSCYVYERN